MNKDYTKEEFMELLGWKKDKFYKNMEEICDIYHIDKDDFRLGENARLSGNKKNMNAYCFKKEWANLAFTLFQMYGDNPYYDQKSRDAVTFDQIIKYNKAILRNVLAIEPVAVQRKVRSHSAYLSLLGEVHALESVQKKLSILFELVSDLSILHRSSIWQDLNVELNTLIWKYATLGAINSSEDKDKRIIELDMVTPAFDFHIANVLKEELKKNHLQSPERTKRMTNEKSQKEQEHLKGEQLTARIRFHNDNMEEKVINILNFQFTDDLNMEVASESIDTNIASFMESLMLAITNNETHPLKEEIEKQLRHNIKDKIQNQLSAKAVMSDGKLEFRVEDFVKFLKELVQEVAVAVVGERFDYYGESSDLMRFKDTFIEMAKEQNTESDFKAILNEMSAAEDKIELAMTCSRKFDRITKDLLTNTIKNSLYKDVKK